MKLHAIIVTLLLALTCSDSALAQTCNSAIVATTPVSRFEYGSDGTVADNATGLSWKRCSEGQIWDGTTCTGSAAAYTWQESLQIGDSAVFAGQNDWRLPNIKELHSIVERQCDSPSINTIIFPATPALAFRTSSPDRAGGVRLVYFDTGYDSAGGLKSGLFAVRLVRGGE